MPILLRRILVACVALTLSAGSGVHGHAKSIAAGAAPTAAVDHSHHDMMAMMDSGGEAGADQQHKSSPKRSDVCGGTICCPSCAAPAIELAVTLTIGRVARIVSTPHAVQSILPDRPPVLDPGIPK